MICHKIKFRCGEYSLKRIVLLKETKYKLQAIIQDKNGNELDTKESWNGRKLQFWWGKNKILERTSPDEAYTEVDLSESFVISVVFGSDRWDLTLEVQEIGINIENPNPVLPSDVEFNSISARTIDTTSIKPPQDGKTPNTIELLDPEVPGTVLVNSNSNGGALIVGNIQTGTTIWNDDLHTGTIKCRNGISLEGGLSAEGDIHVKGICNAYMPATQISAGSITLLDDQPGNGTLSCSEVNAYGTHTKVFSVKNASTIEGWTDLKSHLQVWPQAEIDIRNSVLAVNGSTEVYCPTSRSESGTVKYVPIVVYLDPPTVTESGDYLMFKRVYEQEV